MMIRIIASRKSSLKKLCWIFLRVNLPRSKYKRSLKIFTKILEKDLKNM